MKNTLESIARDVGAGKITAAEGVPLMAKIRSGNVYVLGKGRGKDPEALYASMRDGDVEPHDPNAWSSVEVLKYAGVLSKADYDVLRTVLGD